MGDSLERIRALPTDIRWEAGGELERVQSGQNPVDFRPMRDVGPGTIEIRLHSDGEFRIFYVAQFAEAVYVLHCFSKKTRTTRQADLQIGRRRYRAMTEVRALSKEKP